MAVEQWAKLVSLMQPMMKFYEVCYKWISNEISTEVMIT